MTAKNALRVKAFKNEAKGFDYQAGGTEELLVMGADVRPGAEKTVYRLDDNIVLVPSGEEPPAGFAKLCTVTNRCTSSDSSGKWWVQVEAASGSGGLSVPPGEVALKSNIVGKEAGTWRHHFPWTIR